jgi:hypothetical protein
MIQLRKLKGMSMKHNKIKCVFYPPLLSTKVGKFAILPSLLMDGHISNFLLIISVASAPRALEPFLMIGSRKTVHMLAIKLLMENQ